MLENKELKRRAVKLTYQNKLSHLSSVLTSIDIIKEIYDQIAVGNDKDIFILGHGHSGLALYTTLESLYPRVDAQTYVRELGIHPTRLNYPIESTEFIDCSTGSLGQGLPIAVGMALARPERTIYVLESDGSMAEGSNWEALRIIEDKHIDNIQVYVNINGQGAYSKIDSYKLAKRLQAFYPAIHLRYTNLDEYPHLKDMGVLQHYKILDEKEYSSIMEVLK